MAHPARPARPTSGHRLGVPASPAGPGTMRPGTRRRCSMDTRGNRARHGSSGACRPPTAPRRWSWPATAPRGPRRLGYTDDDLSGGGSDRFVDDLVFWGDPDTVVRKLHGHVEAGADHVAVQVIGVEPGESALPQWRSPAEALRHSKTADGLG